MNDPKIVLFDLETLPNLPAALEVWTQLGNYPGLTLKASISSIACAGFKILGKKNPVQMIHAWDYPAWKRDVNNDKAVCEALYENLHDADCVVTHNGKRFDFKFLQTRLRYWKLPNLPKMKHVDTCSEAKTHLYTFNNRLNTLAKFLTNTEKMEHEGWDLWVKTHARHKKSMKTMSEYCAQDVITLEALFYEIRPLIKSLPNFNLFNPAKASVCPSCGSSRLQSRGIYITTVKKYHRYHCQDCGSWSRTDAKDELPR